jgi:hypothetical protein
MTKQSTLFPEDEPAVQPAVAPSNSLATTVLKRTATQDSPAHKRFHQLVTQTETVARNIETLRQAVDAHRIRHAALVTPLTQQRDAHFRQMALWLADRLQRKGLSAKQKHIAQEIVCSLAGRLAMQGDEEMQALYDAHSDQSMEQTEKEAAADLQRMMEGILGEPLGDDAKAFESVDELMHAAMHKVKAHDEALAQSRAQRAATKKKTAAQLKKEQLAATQAQDADSALRTLYRQLASALHPDREHDPQEQLRKTALMKEANAAYERRDLLALLQLQLQAELATEEKVASMAAERLATLTALLKERVAVLKHELRMVQQKAIAEFELPAYSTLSQAQLLHHMLLEESHLKADIAMLEQDLVRVKDDTYLKRWLKEQEAALQPDFGPLSFL